MLTSPLIIATLGLLSILIWLPVLVRGWQALGEASEVPAGADASDLPGVGLIQKHVMNDREIAKQMLRLDVDRLGESVRDPVWAKWFRLSNKPPHALEDFIAFSDSGDDWLWEPVEADLVRLAEAGKRIKIVVSEPDFSNKAETRVIRRLSGVHGITVVQLPERPPVDLRLVNGRHLHIAYHSKQDDTEFKRPCWRSRHRGAHPQEVAEAVAFIRSTESKQIPLAA